jgi:two-component system chemotaxis response regulator CheB
VDTDPAALRQEIVAKVRAASQVKVIRSLRPRRPGQQEQPQTLAGSSQVDAPSRSELSATKPQRRDILPFLPGGVVVIGASTGGPLALRELLGNLPVDFPAAIIVVQHMPATFTGVLAAQLDRHVSLQVKEAEAGDRLQPGLVLVAPGDHHLLLRPDARVELNQGPAIAGHRPSIDVTMQSVAQVYGSRTRGIVLTGMGNDGARGLVSIRAKGGATFAQDAASCVVNGMPQRATETGGVNHVAPPSEIARLLRLDRRVA